MTERRLAGWEPGTTKDVEKRISPHLVPWEDLPEDIQQYDFDLIDILPGVLASANRRIHR